MFHVITHGKTLEEPWFSYVFKGCKNGTLACKLLSKWNMYKYMYLLYKQVGL